MSGILDNRTRIMDTIVTLEGRRQMADGKLKIEYISFTDNHTFYDVDAVEGAADATKRLYFEQCHLPQDQITLEADDSGKLKPFKLSSNTQNNYFALSGLIDFVPKESPKKFEILSSTFSSTAESLIKSSTNNFKNLNLLSTRDYIFEDNGFEISQPNVEFSVSSNFPIESKFQNQNLELLPSLFNDKNLGNVINFKYLPPINKINDESVTNKSSIDFLEKNKIGNYQDLSNSFYTADSLENELLIFEKNGFKKTIKFDPSSLQNNIVSQFFEVTSDDMKKLEVIDYGSYRYRGINKHAFFVGKVFEDDLGSQTFIKLFTIVFE